MSSSTALGDVLGQSTGGEAESVVERDGSGEREESADQAGSETVEGACAVALEGEDVFGGPVDEQLSNVVDWAMKNDQAATLSSVVVSSSVILMPSLNVTPSSTSATSSWPLTRRQRSWAASKSL